MRRDSLGSKTPAYLCSILSPSLSSTLSSILHQYHGQHDNQLFHRQCLSGTVFFSGMESKEVIRLQFLQKHTILHPKFQMNVIHIHIAVFLFIVILDPIFGIMMDRTNIYQRNRSQRKSIWSDGHPLIRYLSLSDDVSRRVHSQDLVDKGTKFGNFGDILFQLNALKIISKYINHLFRQFLL